LPISSPHEKFLGILVDNGLTQIIDKPTRHNNTLDLFVSNNPSLIQSTQVIPGLADHEAVVVEVDLPPITNMQKPRRIPLFNKAGWDGFRADMQNFHFQYPEGVEDVECTWQSFTCHLKKGLGKFIPFKTARNRNNLPWINADLKHLIQKRDNYFKIKNTTHNPRDIKHHKSLKREVQKKNSTSLLGLCQQHV